MGGWCGVDGCGGRGAKYVCVPKAKDKNAQQAMKRPQSLEQTSELCQNYIVGSAKLTLTYYN